MKKILVKTYNAISHTLARIFKKYYWEDFVRVYPDGIHINRYGRQNQPTQSDLRNFLNHQKFYRFAAQFAHEAVVADIGCGSGYGCDILQKYGAVHVHGADASARAIKFARNHFNKTIYFTVQGITNLNLYQNDSFDLTVCSEVLEHIKEYGKEELAIQELKRITRPGGIIVIGTPNSELLGDHGFYYEEIEVLLKKHFTLFCIFENALIPFNTAKELWESRLAESRTGVIVTEAINLAETVIPNNSIPQLKKGIAAGNYLLGSLNIDTTLLHNTHSWAIVAIKDQE